MFLPQNIKSFIERKEFTYPIFSLYKCEYIRRSQTSDFKLLSDAKCILGRTVRVKEVESLPKAIYFSCDRHRKNRALTKSKQTVNEFQKSIYTRAQ